MNVINSYQKGKRWGYAIFRRHVRDYGMDVGGHKSDKACETCKKYVYTGKKNGQALSKDERAFYKGACAGMLEYYNKHY